jgi:hypothetical protein
LLLKRAKSTQVKLLPLHDGAVTVDEFEAAVPQPDTQEVFDSADTDRDTFIGWQEFLHAMTSGM